MSQAPVKPETRDDATARGRTRRAERYTRQLRIPARWTPTVPQMTVTLVVLGVLWRIVRYAMAFPIWGDEAFVAVNFVVRDYAEMLDPLIYGQIVPLFFMWIELAVSDVLGYSEWALRLVPFLAGVGAVPLFWWFARRVLPRRSVLPAVGLLACSYFAVRHGAEVKPYSTDLLVGLLLFILGWRVLEQPQATGRWAALIVAAGAGVWCSYPAVFVAGGIGLVLTWRLVELRGARRVLIGWLAYGAVLCGSFLVLYVTYAKPHAESAGRLVQLEMWTLAFPPLGEPWKLPLWLVGIHTGRMFAYPQGGKPPGSIVTTVLFVVGAVTVWRRNRMLAALLLAPLPLALLGACFKAYPYGGTARTMLYVAPAICLLAGHGWFLTLRRFLHGEVLRAGLIISAIGLGALAVVGMIRDIREPYRSDPVLRSHDAVRTVAAQSGPGDAWIIFNADRPVPHAPYLGDWHGTGGQFVFDALRFAPTEPVWSPPPESVAAPPDGDVWLLVYYAEHARTDDLERRIDFPEEQLEAYVSRLEAKLGTPQRRRFVIKDEERRGKFEALDVYRFP